MYCYICFKITGIGDRCGVMREVRRVVKCLDDVVDESNYGFYLDYAEKAWAKDQNQWNRYLRGLQ